MEFFDYYRIVIIILVFWRGLYYLVARLFISNYLLALEDFGYFD